MECSRFPSRSQESAQRHERPKNYTAGLWQERLVTTGLWIIALGVVGIFAWIGGDLLARGVHQLSFDFLLQPPQQAGKAGGISTILVGTLCILSVALGSALRPRLKSCYAS